MTPPGKMRTLTISKGVHTVRSAAKASSPDFSYSVSLDIEEITPEPEPLPELLPSHGPAVIRKEVLIRFPCQATIVDLNQNLWNFTAQLFLYDPNGNEVFPRPSPTSVHEKMSMGTNHSWDLTDPLEGEYTCRVDFWLDYDYLGPDQAKKTLTYIVPSGESNAMPTWSPPNMIFRVTLTGGNFNGRRASEFDGSGYTEDQCHFPGSARDPFEHVQAPDSWFTIYDNAYLDVLGWSPADITYYRGIPNKVPCLTTLSQDMKINRPGRDPVVYITNSLEMAIYPTQVESRRANTSDLRNY
jgi:hypothetical protein